MIFDESINKDLVKQGALSFVANMLIDEVSSATYKRVFSMLDAQANGKLDVFEIYSGFNLYNKILK